MWLYNFLGAGGLLLKRHESLLYTVPEYIITELSWQVVLDLLPFNSLLHLKHPSGGVGEAVGEHMEQSFLHMKSLILAPAQQQHHHQKKINMQTHVKHTKMDTKCRLYLYTATLTFTSYLYPVHLQLWYFSLSKGWMSLRIKCASAAMAATCQLLCHSRFGWSAGVPPCPLHKET